MLDTLRKPFFILAVVLLSVAVLIELGAGAVLRRTVGSTAALDVPGPGVGLRATGVLDVLLLYTVLVIGAALIIPERIQGRIQGIATLIFSILLLIGDITLLMGAFVLLVLMLTLFLAPPFGTLAYFAMWGDFDTDRAKILLGVAMTLKLAFAGCLVAAHQRFLQNKGLVLLVLLSIAATFVLGLLHGIVPGFLVSITDGAGAVVFTVVVAVLTVCFLIGAVISVVKAVV